MKITMAHGSGGKTSAELMSSVFGKHFKNSVLDKMEDAAVLEISGKSPSAPIPLWLHRWNLKAEILASCVFAEQSMIY